MCPLFASRMQAKPGALDVYEDYGVHNPDRLPVAVTGMSCRFPGVMRSLFSLLLSLFLPSIILSILSWFRHFFSLYWFHLTLKTHNVFPPYPLLFTLLIRTSFHPRDHHCTTNMSAMATSGYDSPNTSCCHAYTVLFAHRLLRFLAAGGCDTPQAYWERLQEGFDAIIPTPFERTSGPKIDHKT